MFRLFLCGSLEKRIDKFLDVTGCEILQNVGKITDEYAKEFAESEFEKYRVIQDCLFRSDFDKLIGGVLSSIENE